MLKKILFSFWSFSIVFATVGVLAATFVENSQATFNGTFSRTQWSAGNNGVVQTNVSQPGRYTSLVKDSNTNSTWQNFRWNTDRPYEKEYPSNAGSDTGYTTGNLNMTGNLAYWKFNEAPGATVFADSSGNGNTANRGATTITTSTTTNIKNNALRVSNTGGYLTTQNGNSVKNLSEVSLSLWVRTPGTLPATDQIIYDEPVAGSNTITRFTLRINNARLSLRGSTTDAGPTTTWLNSTTTLVRNTWYHVVAVVNTNTDVQKLYINGVVQSANVTLSPFPNTNPNVTPRIGRNSALTFNFSGGFMDEMALFNRELTSTEVNDMLLRGMRLRFQVQSCTVPANCTAANFRGPGNNKTTWYSELNSTTLSGPPVFALTNTITPVRRYFQYRAQFQNFTNNTTFTAILKGVTVTYSDPPSLSFAVRDSTDTVNTNSCQFGNATIVAVSSCSYRLDITTSAPSGYTVSSLTSGNFSNGVSTIANAAIGSGGTGGDDISNATAGTEKYGVNLNAGSATVGTITENPIFDAGAVNETNYSHISNTLLYSSNGPNTPASTDLVNTALVTHNWNISADTESGQYSQSVTYTVVPIF